MLLSANSERIEEGINDQKVKVTDLVNCSFKTIDLAPAVCWHYKNKGFCKLGNDCKFLHVKNFDDNNDNKDIKLSYYLYKTKEMKYKVSVLRRTFEENGFTLMKEITNELNFYWGNSFPSSKIETFSFSTLINHFPNSHHLTNKNLMTLHLQNLKDFSYLPISFVLPNQMNEFIEFNKLNLNNLWITKPYNSERKKESKCIASIYISNPLLINNKKFDLRLYVLLIGKGRQIYLYKDGIVRFASEDYSNNFDSLNNLFIHITNNTINDKMNAVTSKGTKHGTKKFGFFNNKSLSELKEEYISSNNFELFWNDLKDLVLKTCLNTIYNKDYQEERFNKYLDQCFELLGFDIMLDEKYFPYLLEVNAMPDLLGVSSSNHLVYEKNFEVKAKMLSEALTIVNNINHCQQQQQVIDIGSFELIQ
ncbi:hypothetical protein ABK040_005498 [Willaertia magna]